MAKTLVQRMTVDELTLITSTCNVCIGKSPKSDGHDQNPPCIGAALQEIIIRARAWDILNESMRIAN